MIIPSEVSQTEMNTMQYYLYVESKRWHKWTSTDQKHTRRQNRFVVAKGRDDGLEVWGSRCKLLYIEWINKCPSVEHRELYSIVNHNGKDVNMYIHIHYIYMYTILWTEEPGGLQSMGSKSQT